MPARADKLAKENDARAPIKDAEEAMARCTELEADLAELKAAYDQYFQGNERVPPQKQHEAFKKALLKTKGAFVRQTAVKFRLESISQKLLTYERLWDRTVKEIESGTYKRDVARLRRRSMREKPKGHDAFDIDEDLDLSDLDEETGGDDLASALAAAEAAVEAKKVAPAVPAVAPVVPAIKPLVPSIAPVSGAVPAVAPVSKPGIPAVAPVSKPGIPAVAPVGSKPGIPAVTPAIPAVTPASGRSGVVPAITPAVAAPVGSKPGIPAVAPVTGQQPAFRPATPVSGSVPAVKPVTGSVPAARPAVASGSMPARPVSGSNPAVRPPAASGSDGLSDQKIKAIYDAYVMAKKRCGEDTRAVTLDSVASSLRKQVPELMKQHNARSVEFKVVIKDGKAVLRALPKDE